MTGVRLHDGDLGTGQGVDGAALRALLPPMWDLCAVHRSTGSTNDDVTAAASGGAGHSAAAGFPVVVADHQSAGRGRNGRRWTAAAGGSVAVSVLVRPGFAMSRWGWLPLMTGVALAESLAPDLAAAGVTPRLKWPNDVVLDGPSAGKVCGILVEVTPAGVVVGAGIDTTLAADQLPVPHATSLALARGGPVDPTAVVAGYLGCLASWWQRFEAAAGDPDASGLRERYLQLSATVGRRVDVHTPTGTVSGVAVEVDVAGCLVLAREGQEPVSLSAGDVVHVR